MRQTTISELLANLLRVVHGRFLGFQMLCKFVEDCNVCIKHAASTGRKTDKFCGSEQFFFSIAFFSVLMLDKIAFTSKKYEQRSAAEAKRLWNCRAILR